ncbi:phosphatase PAP2 family protein [Candidatus Woesearchaeota archaeon]|nr:phosphatase PAP2 family protein [Candidatus Woesearchaeota archaeon]
MTHIITYMVSLNLITGSILALDRFFNIIIPAIWNPTLTIITILITDIVSVPFMAFLSITTFAILIFRRKWYHSILLFFGMSGSVILELLTKFIVQRARPENNLIEVSNHSFFSGHAEVSLVFFTIIFLSFNNEIKNKIWKNIFMAFCILMPLLIGFSRLYLSVHWFSDIIAGYIIGIIWIIFLILILNKMGKRYNKKLEKIRINLERLL